MSGDLFHRINAELLPADAWRLRGGWLEMTNAERAAAVITWAQGHGIDTGSVLARPLAAAVESNNTRPMPAHFLRMLQAVVAYLGAR